MVGIASEMREDLKIMKEEEQEEVQNHFMMEEPDVYRASQTEWVGIFDIHSCVGFFLYDPDEPKLLGGISAAERFTAQRWRENHRISGAGPAEQSIPILLWERRPVKKW